MSINESLLIPASHQASRPLDPDHPPNEKQQELEDRQEAQGDLLEFVRETNRRVKALDNADWLRILRSQVRATMYYDDRQYGEVTPEGMWRDFDRSPGDIRPIDNQYKIHVDKLLMEMARSQTELGVRPRNPNRTDLVEASKFAKARIEANAADLNAAFTLRECQSLLLKAMTYRYSYFIPEADDQASETRPVTTQKQTGSDREIEVCKYCSAPMKADESGQPKCVKCGNTIGKLISLTAKTVNSTEYKPTKGGKVCTVHLDPTMVRISLNARMSVRESPFVWYRQRVMRCVLEESFPDVKIPSSAQESESEASRYKADAERTPSNTYDSSWNNKADRKEGGFQFESVDFDLFWYDPVVYRMARWKAPQKMVGGELPAMQSLGDEYPNGCCIAAVGDTILGIYGEDKNKKLVFCVYGIREHGLMGAGTNALIGLQDTRNDLLSYLIANTFYNAASREFIRADAFTGNQLPALNQTGVITNVPEDKPLAGWAYAKAEGNPLPAQTLELVHEEAGAMQEQAGTASMVAEGTSAQTQAFGTATGIAYMRDSQVGRMGPNLMLKTDMEEEWAYQILELEKENISPERFLAMANQNVVQENIKGNVSYAAEGVKAFIDPKTNIRRDFIIEAKPGSWTPRTEAERQAKFEGFVNLASKVAEAMANDPRAEQIISMAADVFGQPIEIGEWTSTERVAATRLKAYARTVGVLEKRGFGLQPCPACGGSGQVMDNGGSGQPQPCPDCGGTGSPVVMVALQMTPQAKMNKEMDNHALFVRFYKEWFASDEGMNASDLLKVVVTQVEIQHRSEGMVWVAQQMAVDKLKAEAPAHAAMEAAAPPQEDPASKISVAYKDLPEDVKRQEEERLGFTPSAEGQPPDNSEETKALATIATETHKAELARGTAREETELEMQQQTHAAQMENLRAEADHERALEQKAHDHAHESTQGAVTRAHESAEAKATREHAERVAKEKPKK